MGFSYDGTQAQVGFHSGRGKHKLEIKVFAKLLGACNEIPNVIPDLTGTETFRFYVGDQPPNVGYFHLDNFQRSPSDNIRDFGWLLDAEGPQMYRDGVEVQRNFFRRRLFVKQG